MKDIPRFAATLTLVALIAAGSLAWVDKITKPRIFAQMEKAQRQALLYVLPGTRLDTLFPVEKDGEVLYYAGYRDAERKELIGYAFNADSKGYSSIIRILAGIDSSGKILAIQILSQQETPSLGTRCMEIRPGETECWWQRQFRNQDALTLAVDKDGGKISSITGATITSRAITQGLSVKARQVIEMIRGESSHSL